MQDGATQNFTLQVIQAVPGPVSRAASKRTAKKHSLTSLFEAANLLQQLRDGFIATRVYAALPVTSGSFNGATAGQILSDLGEPLVALFSTLACWVKCH
jgi:hypothetical protein